MAAADIVADLASMDDAALLGVLVAVQDALAARNAELQDDARPAAKNVVAHRRYAMGHLDQAAGRLRLCAAHPLEPVADRPRIPRIDESGRDARLNGRPHP